MLNRFLSKYRKFWYIIFLPVLVKISMIFVKEQKLWSKYRKSWYLEDFGDDLEDFGI